MARFRADILTSERLAISTSDKPGSPTLLQAIDARAGLTLIVR